MTQEYYIQGLTAFQGGVQVGIVHVDVCKGCGAVVADCTQHDRFHNVTRSKVD